MTTKAERDKQPFIFVRDVNKNKIKRIAVPSDFQVGTKSDPKELQVLGRVSLGPRRVTLTANQLTGTLTNNDSIVEVETAASVPDDSKILLPQSPRNGQIIFIKDYSGAASLNNIKVITAGPELIDGNEQLTIGQNYDSIALFWNVDGWQTLIENSTSTFNITSSQPELAEADYNPPGWSAATVMRLNPVTTNSVISGFDASVTEFRKTLFNVSELYSVTLLSEGITSLEDNRLIMSDSSIVISPSGGLEVVYDPISSRWRGLE